MNCLDVNECLDNNGGCHSKRTCTNTMGGRTCGNCKSGYINDGDTGCEGPCELLNESDLLVIRFTSNTTCRVREVCFAAAFNS